MIGAAIRKKPRDKNRVRLLVDVFPEVHAAVRRLAWRKSIEENREVTMSESVEEILRRELADDIAAIEAEKR